MKVTRHRLQFQFTLAALPVGWTHASSILLVQVANQQFAQIDRLHILIQWLQSNRLSHKSASNKTQAPEPFDVAAIAHTPHGPLFGIDWWRQCQRKAAGTGAIDLCWRALPQSLVRTLVVVKYQPAARTSLHHATVGRAFGNDFPLIAAMKLFVRGIVAWARPASKLDPNAQPQPPDRQTREPQRSFAAKGGAVVHTNGLGHSPCLKQACHSAPYGLIVLVGQQLQAQAVTAEQVAHSQWLLAHAIVRTKPAFEIHRPDLVGATGYRQSRVRQGRPTPGAFGVRTDPSLALQPTLKAAHTGQAATRILSPQLMMNLFAAPMGPSTAYSLNGSEPEQGQTLGRTARSSRLIPQTGEAALTESVQPFVSGLAADTEPARKHLDGLMTCQHCFDQALTHFEQRNGFPRHDRRKRRNLLKKCYPCPVPSLSPMSCHRAPRVPCPAPSPDTSALRSPPARRRCVTRPLFPYQSYPSYFVPSLRLCLKSAPSKSARQCKVKQGSLPPLGGPGNFRPLLPAWRCKSLYFQLFHVVSILQFGSFLTPENMRVMTDFPQRHFCQNHVHFLRNSSRKKPRNN
jgi:hypothetical protein